MLNLVLADDSTILRESLAGMLQRQGFNILDTCDNAAILPALVDSLVNEGTSPQVVITDVRMPPHMKDDGLKAATQIRSAHPHIGVLVFSQYVAPAYARAILDMTGENAPATGSKIKKENQPTTGGVGYLLKDTVGKVADFVRTINAVAQGAVVIDPEVASAMVAAQRSRMNQLTDRESEVLTLMAKGLSNTEIAKDLYISGAAVGKHVSNIFSKLGLEVGEENRRVKAILTYLNDVSM